MINRRIYYAALLVWSIIYVAGTILAPLAPNHFNITPEQTHLLQVSLAIPVVLIWLAAVYGAERFKSYAQCIKSDRDGKAMNQVANGLNILVIAVLSNGISAIIRPWAYHDGWLRAFTIIFNYVQVALPLIALYVMYRGSVRLRAIAKSRENLRSWLPIIGLAVVIAAIYFAILLSYQYRSHTPDPNEFSSFYLPDPLLVLTVALPNVVAWTLGFKAASNIIIYQRRVQGVIYRNALFRFATGIIIIIAFAVLLQLLIGLSAHLAKAGLGSILFLLYVIILIYSIGFLIVASGTKRLNAIEKAGVKK